MSSFIIRVSKDTFNHADYENLDAATHLVLVDSVLYFEGQWTLSSFPDRFKQFRQKKFLQLIVDDHLLAKNTQFYPNWYGLFSELIAKGISGLEFVYKTAKLFTHDQSFLNAQALAKRLDGVELKFGLIMDDYLAQEEKVLRQWMLFVEYAVVKSYGYYSYENFGLLNGSAKLLLPKSDAGINPTSLQLDKIPNDLTYKCVLGLSTAAIHYHCGEGDYLPAVNGISDVYRKDVYYKLQLKPNNLKEEYQRHNSTFLIKEGTSVITMECAATIVQKLNYFIEYRHVGGVYLENPIYDLPVGHYQSIYQKYLQWKDLKGWKIPVYDIWQTPQHTLVAKRNEKQDPEGVPELSNKKPRLEDEAYMGGDEGVDVEPLFQMEDV